MPPTGTLSQLSSRHDDCPQALVDPETIRQNDYESFMVERQKALLNLIEEAMKKEVLKQEEDEDYWGEVAA